MLTLKNVLAYVGDEKKIPGILAAYGKAADAVIAATPADRFKVMEEVFTATNAHSVLVHQLAILMLVALIILVSVLVIILCLFYQDKFS